MSHARLLKFTLPAASAVLLTAGCSAVTTDAVDTNGAARTTSTGWTVQAQPDGRGAAVLGAIANATTSVDIPIYSITTSGKAPYIGNWEDPLMTNALLAAKQRGVNIRIIVNGGFGRAQPDQLTEYVTRLSAGPGSGKVTMNYSSNNFSITHQKSIITDAADAKGQALAAGSLPPTAQLVVSTGNFDYFNSADQADPDMHFYDPRDFEMSTSDPAAITETEQTFVSDFTCAGTSVIQPNGLQASDRLIWSNGTTGPVGVNDTAPAPGVYPGLDPGYWGFPATGVLNPKAAVEGNVRSMQKALIESANPGDTLKIYNEEFSDPESLAMLNKAAADGVNVQVTMTAGSPPSATKPASTTWTGQVNLAKAGGVVHLYSNKAGVLYVHAKAIILVPKGSTVATKAYSGSTNLAGGSMDLNRELGVNFDVTTGDAAALEVLNSTFDEDFAQTKDVTVWDKSGQPLPPASSEALPPTATSAVPSTKSGQFTVSDNAACGSVLGSSASKKN